MSSNQPTTGRDILPAGIDVRKIRKPLNDAFAAIPTEIVSEGAATSRDGRRMSFSVIGEDIFYIRLTDRSHGGGSSNPHKYSWVAVVQDRDNGTWQNSPRTGNIADDWACELNNQNISPNTGERFPARRNPQSGRVTFYQGKGGGGGGNFTANSSETVLMILGTYDDYKNCPNVPPQPPTTFSNLPCSDNRTASTLCVPAYAYAVYQRCGYVWNKIGDTRTYGVWANEMNGGSTSAWRRFFIPRWGGQSDPVSGLPDPNSECMGLAFLGYNSQGALTCSCPTWASSGQCIKAKFRVIDRPFPTGNGGYTDCNGAFELLDDGDAEGPYWGREFEVLINLTGSLCSDGSDGTGPLTFSIIYEDTGRNRCYWGPDVFDPCDPCAGFGRFYISAELNTNTPQPNCGGAGHFTGYLSEMDLREIICDCEEKPLREIVPCNACDGDSGLPPLHFIDFESLVFTCCDPE